MDKERERTVEGEIKDLENLEVTELDDENLEDVAGGDNLNCGCIIVVDPS